MITANSEAFTTHPMSGTPDDDDDRDDERAGENEASTREVDDRTEAPEEFDVADEYTLRYPEDDAADEQTDE
ncbi:MAG: hypothetical protein ABSH33_20445 [Steroidobacteraceae bacterium]|jgi:hypothetical protein